MSYGHLGGVLNGTLARLWSDGGSMTVERSAQANGSSPLYHAAKCHQEGTVAVFSERTTVEVLGPFPNLRRSCPQCHNRAGSILTARYRRGVGFIIPFRTWDDFHIRCAICTYSTVPDRSEVDRLIDIATDGRGLPHRTPAILGWIALGCVIVLIALLIFNLFR
jgi:hypothetical protein